MTFDSNTTYTTTKLHLQLGNISAPGIIIFMIFINYKVYRITTFTIITGTTLELQFIAIRSTTTVFNTTTNYNK